MTHGDDDGLRLPPAIAPRQIVVVPMLRDKPEDAEVLAYCEELVKALSRDRRSASRCARLLDTKKIKSAEKRWNWVRRGAPIIVEVGPRDAAAGQVTYMRRDDLRDGDKVKSIAKPRGGFPRRRGAAPGRDPGRALCRSQGAAGRQHQERHHQLRRAGRLFRPATRTSSKAGCAWPGPSPPARRWKRWSRSSKALKLTIRNAPADQPQSFGPCLFTGAPGVEEILIGRAY